MGALSKFTGTCTRNWNYDITLVRVTDHQVRTRKELTETSMEQDVLFDLLPEEAKLREERAAVPNDMLYVGDALESLSTLDSDST